METISDQSYGVIPLFKVATGWEVLLINQIGRRGDQFWTLPKGHAEGVESPIAAAVRELQEETGLTDVQIQTDPVFTTQYTFVHQATRIEKQVHYYLGFCQTTTTVVTQPHEIAAVQWYTLDQAQQVLSHNNTKLLLGEVAAYLDALPAKADTI